MTAEIIPFAPKPAPDKPCPFCGSTSLDPASSDTEAWVECEDCGAQGPWATIGCRDDDDGEIDLDAEALEAWNKRVTP